MFSNHPFVQNTTHQFQILPPQMLPLNKKDETWKHQCMDAMEYIARIQWMSNQKMYTNYKLVNGEFIPSEYGLEDEYKDPLAQLTQDFNVPSFIKNYDIISQPLNTMTGELDTYPDKFVVVGKGEQFENEKLRVKSDLLKKFLLNQIEQFTNLKLIEEGLDPNFNDFQSEEEQQQYLEQVQQKKEEILNPLQIEDWINTKYRHIAEIWGEVELEDQKERFNLYDVRRVEFKDYLTVGRRFRHIYLKANGFGIESWNPINTFYHKSPEVKYIQDGDYVGQIHILSIPEIIDRYGYLMTSEQLESLQLSYTKSYQDSALVKKTLDGKELDYLHPTGIPYVTRVPSLDRFVNEFAPQVKDFPATAWFLNEEQLDRINGGENYLNAIAGMYQVTEAYWKSHKRIGKLYWLNPETSIPEKLLIDESFVIPNYITEKQGTIDYQDEDELNTITWTYINEIWKGIKISNAGTHSTLSQPIYLDIRRHDIQQKGDTLIYEAKLPVGGQIANNRNTMSAGLVDLLKPYQFLYNVLMNQAYQYLEKEIMPFILMDINLIPNDKDWGGKKNLEKWLDIAKAWGIVPADTSPANTQGANAGGQLPKVIDLDMSQRIVTRIQLAQNIKQLALEQIGIAPQRLGDVKASETATGINQAMSRSYTQTSSWFTDFFACERELLKMQLNVAQVLQSKNKDVLASMTKSDMTTAFLKFNDNEFSLYDLHVYISNSQEDLRNLEMVRKLGIENNTLMTKMSDRIKMSTSNSIPEIVNTILKTEREETERRMQEQQLAQQQLQNQKQIEDDKLALERELAYAKMQVDLERAYITATGFNENVGQDTNGNTIPDVLEQLKFISTENINASKLNIQQQKLNNDKEIQSKQVALQEAKLNLDKLKEANKLKIEKEKLKRAKVQGDKSK